MPSSAGPNTAGESNLVFAYDLGDVINSYKGEPTTNFAYLHNGRKDSSYESYMPGSGTGQIAALHPGAIRIYNQAGSDISYYLNTGINTSNSGVEWYDTNHAYWVYDEVLKKPVVQMIDKTGVWQAKYMGLGVTWADLGLTNGDQYTMSWLQWSSDGVKRAHAGVYWYDTTAGGHNFWDGLSDTGNSTPGVWTRVSQTFTLSAGKSLNQGLSWYMYGMYFSRAILKIADIQLEKKSHATTFTFTNTRSVTQGLVSAVGSGTANLTNVSFNSSAQPIFDGTNDYIDLGLLNITSTPFTYETVIKTDSITGGYAWIVGKAGYDMGLNRYDNYIKFFLYDSSNNLYSAEGGTLNTSSYFHVVGVYTGVNLTLYINGVPIQTSAGSITVPRNYDGQTTYVGTPNASNLYYQGQIPIVKIYNRALTTAEVRQNYQAYKSRFNLA